MLQGDIRAQLDEEKAKQSSFAIGKKKDRESRGRDRDMKSDPSKKSGMGENGKGVTSGAMDLGATGMSATH